MIKDTRNMTTKERLGYLSPELEKRRNKKVSLLREEVKLENIILGKPDAIIHLGNTKCEMVFGTLYKNLTQDQKKEQMRRSNKLASAKKKPYNKFYAERIEKINNHIARIEKELKVLIVRKDVAEIKRYNEYKEYPYIDIIGKPYEETTKAEQREYNRIVRRAMDEKKKMELGLPPYDKKKIKKV